MVVPSSLPDTGVLELKARSSERRHGDAPFLSHDYRETAAWLRRVSWHQRAYLPLQHFSGGISVALHVRNGDRLPGKRYAKHARLNLGDDYYLGVVKALQSISSVDVVAFGASVAAKKSSQLLDAQGNVSRIPVEVPDAKIVLDGDPLEALTHMARADVLVAARSQFSYAAIALSQGVVVYPSKWHAHRQSVPRFAAERVAKCHVPASDSGIDRDRLAAALRACRVVKTVCLSTCLRGRAVARRRGAWRSDRVGEVLEDLLGDDDLAELDGRRWSPLRLPEAHRRGADQNAGDENTCERHAGAVGQRFIIRVVLTTTTIPWRRCSSSSSALFLRFLAPSAYQSSASSSKPQKVMSSSSFPPLPALLHSQTNVTVRALEDRVFRALARRHALLRADVVGFLAADFFTSSATIQPHPIAGARLARLVIAPVAREAAAPFISLAGDRAGLEARLSGSRTSDRSSPCPCTGPSRYYTRRTSRPRSACSCCTRPRCQARLRQARATAALVDGLIV